MKNLKKVLSLGLALVMLLGMFTVASAAEDKKIASDLTDWNTVQHKDAVSLMVDLGIINGMPDGSFAPTGNIDRASWAKMVYYAATGSDDADAYLGTASGLNDIAGNWAESYISFLKANDYISGDNFGNYNPSANVTVAEACKMMLTVLGYDAEDRGYQNNTAWAGNIMTDAKRNGLMDNVDKEQTALVPLTRENAAEIVLNALNANMVDAEMLRDNGEKYVHTYTKLYTLGYDVFNMVKVTATVGGIDTNGFATFSAVTAPEIAGQGTWNIQNSLNGKVKAAANLVGEDVNVYVRAEGSKWDEKTGEQNAFGTFQSVISSAAAKADATPVKVITGGILKWSDLTKRGTSNFVATAFDITGEGDDAVDNTQYYLNGSSNTTKEAVQAAAKKRGTVVEFYTNTDGNISIVKAYEYTVGQVTNGDAASKTLSDGTVQVKVPGISGLQSWVDADKVTGWQGLVENDVVLYYKTPLDGGSNDFSWTLEKAEKVTSKVTSFSTDGQLTIAGNRYRGSEQVNAGQVGDVSFNASSTAGDYSDIVFGNWTGSYNLVDEYDFYLDKNGSIVAGVQITESLDASKVCMILQAEDTGSSLGTNNSLRAELLFVDGTKEIVSISKVATAETGYKLKNVVDKNRLTDGTKQIAVDAAWKSISGGSSNSTAMTKFFNWRSTSAGYELTELNSDQNARNWEDPAHKFTTDDKAVASVWKNDGNFAKTVGATASTQNLSGWNIKADSTTTFVVGKVSSTDGSVAYSVFKGIKNIPEMDVTKMTAICANTASDPTLVNNVAKFVYLETGSFKDDVPEGYIFIRDAKATIDPELADDEVYLVNIIDTDGSETTMRVTGSLKDDIIKDADNMLLSQAAARNYVGHFFAVGEIDENGTVASLNNGEATPADRFVTMDTVEGMGNDVITLANASYTYDESTVFVYVDMGWADGTTSENLTNVREEGKDEVSYSGAGTFDPNGFYNENDVDAGNAAGENDKGVTYKSVQAAVICPANSTIADYVYVVRELW